MTKKVTFSLIGIIAVIVIAIYLIPLNKEDTSENSEVLSEWRTAELKDIRTGETFTIDQFDKPVLLESFAVWCPTCTKQQQEIQRFHDLVGDDVISISLDTDPNEAESNVREHLERQGFEWIFAVSPSEVTQSLVNEFGVGFVNAPQVPTVLIREDGSTEFLRSGVKPAEELQELLFG